MTDVSRQPSTRHNFHQSSATDLEQLTPGEKEGPVCETVKMKTKQKSENLHVPRASKEIQERVESGLKQHTDHREVNFENWPITGSLTKEGKFSGKRQVTRQTYTLQSHLFLCL